MDPNQAPRDNEDFPPEEDSFIVDLRKDEPVPVVDPLKNLDGVVQHVTLDQYQQDRDYCEYVLNKLKMVGFDLLRKAQNKLLRVNAIRVKDGKKKIGEFVYAYDITGTWFVKYVDEDGNRSPFPFINGPLDMDFLNRLLKMKIILPDPFLENRFTTVFCEAFGFNEEKYMHAYHRFLGEVDLYSEGLDDQFGSDEDSDPITATLNRIDNLPTGSSPTGSSSATSDSVGTRTPFRRVSLFGYPQAVGCGDTSPSSSSGTSGTDITSGDTVQSPVASPSTNRDDTSSSGGSENSPGASSSEDEILLRSKKWHLSQEATEETDDEDDSPEKNPEDPVAKKSSSGSDGDLSDGEEEENEESEANQDEKEEEDNDESPKKKQKTGGSDKENEEEEDTVNGDEDNDNEDNDNEDDNNDNEDNGSGAGASVGSFGGVLLSTGSWSY
ncbi:unknown protein [Seminavis robusta]|uniref:Uncharacterized protein n=1 Tax=Seminavis robusta TaxID=568900 RepID=A0A9N8EJ16_9STRA|nr:unknown protein [Seminavis robusta]|eukprot:Sro1281_g258950.1 n/a (439) ;mRNA; f:27063-28379